MDATEEEFAALEKGIRDMAKVLPASANEIAAVAESAGQLGIQKENILAFSRTMIDLGEATNLTADEAATAFARFANITKMPQTEFDKLGSVVVELGNNMATTEAEIVSMSMRLAAQGKQVGMSEAEIMALAGTMSSLGVEADAGGSAMTMVLTKIQKAVGKGGKDLAKFAKAAGMSAKEFADSFKSDPVKALEQLSKGLGTSAEAGGNMSAILDDLGIKGIREADVMKRLAGNSELLGEAVATANGAWEANTALTDEAAQRYETFESKLAIFKNVILDLGISIGDVLLPFITTLVEKLTGMVDWFSNLNPKIIEAGTVFTAVAGAVMLVAGPMLMLIGFIPNIISGFAAVKTVLLALTGPIGITIAAITGIIAVLVLAYNKIEWFRNLVDKAWAKIKELTSIAFTAVKDVITKIIGEVSTFVNEQLTKIKAIWDEHGEAIMSIIKLAFGIVWERIKMTMGLIKGLFEIIWPFLSGIVKVVWGVIKTTIRNVMDIILGIIDTIMKLIKGDWEGAWNSIKGTAENIVGNIVKFFQEVDLVQIGKDIIDGLIKGISSMIGAVATAAKNIATKVKDTVTGFFQVKSPSRVFIAIGKFLGVGLAMGITEEEKRAEEASKALSQTVIAGARKLLVEGIASNNKEIEELNKKARAETSKLEQRASEDIRKIQQTAAKAKRKLTEAEAIKIRRIEEDSAKKIADINSKSAASVNKIVKEAQKAKLDSVNSYISDKRKLEQITLKDEVAIWKQSVKSFKDGSDEKHAAMLELRDATRAVDKQLLDDSLAFIDEKKRHGEIGLADELRMLGVLEKEFATHSTKYADIQKRKADVTKEISVKIVAINEEHLQKVAKINDDLAASEQKLNDEYNNAYSSRVSAILGFSGLFDEFVVKMEKTGHDLISNLQSQVVGLSEWRAQLDSLWGKIDDQSLMEELEALGPKALGELKALNGLSEAELTQYVALYNAKFALARDQATYELAGLKDDTEGQIDELRKTANTELTKLQKDWQSKIKGVTAATKTEFQTLTSIGKDAIRGLQDGMKSMESSLLSTARSIAVAVSKTIAEALQVRSPSRVMMRIGGFVGAGLAQGIADMKRDVERSAELLAKATVVKPDMSYKTPNGSYGSLSSALNGTVDVNTNDSLLAGAVASLEDKLTNLTIVMNDREVARATSDEMNKELGRRKRSSARGAFA